MPKKEENLYGTFYFSRPTIDPHDVSQHTALDTIDISLFINLYICYRAEFFVEKYIDESNEKIMVSNALPGSTAI